MRHMIVSIAIAGALVAGNAFAAAGPSATEPHKMLGGFTLENVADSARAVGFQATIEQDKSGARYVIAASPDGIKIIADMSSCQAAQKVCTGLALNVLWNTGVSAELLQKFGQQHIFASALSDGTHTALVRLEIADFGIPMGNIASNFANMNSLAKVFRDFVNASGVNASLEGGAAGMPAMHAFSGLSGKPEEPAPFAAISDAQWKNANNLKP